MARKNSLSSSFILKRTLNRDDYANPHIGIGYQNLKKSATILAFTILSK